MVETVAACRDQIAGMAQVVELTFRSSRTLPFQDRIRGQFCAGATNRPSQRSGPVPARHGQEIADLLGSSGVANGSTFENAADFVVVVNTTITGYERAEEVTLTDANQTEMEIYQYCGDGVLPAAQSVDVEVEVTAARRQSRNFNGDGSKRGMPPRPIRVPLAALLATSDEAGQEDPSITLPMYSSSLMVPPAASALP